MCSGITNGGVSKAIVFRKESSVRPRSIAKRGCRFVLSEPVYTASRSRVYAFAVSVRYRSKRGITLRRLMSTIGILSLFGTTQILGFYIRVLM